MTTDGIPNDLIIFFLRNLRERSQVGGNFATVVFALVVANQYHAIATPLLSLTSLVIIN